MSIVIRFCASQYVLSCNSYYQLIICGESLLYIMETVSLGPPRHYYCNLLNFLSLPTFVLFYYVFLWPVNNLKNLCTLGKHLLQVVLGLKKFGTLYLTAVF